MSKKNLKARQAAMKHKLLHGRREKNYKGCEELPAHIIRAYSFEAYSQIGVRDKAAPSVKVVEK